MIIVITSCQGDKDRGWQQAAKDTWRKTWPWAKVLVVRGEGGSPPDADEFIAACPDKYENTPGKHQYGVQCALRTGYNWALLACNDTYVHVPHLMLSEYDKHDYTGVTVPNDRYASGGAGFVVSRNAMRVLADASTEGIGWSDQWAGHALEGAGIKLHDDPRYLHTRTLDPPRNAITVHLSKNTGNFDPADMRAVHANIGG